PGTLSGSNYKIKLTSTIDPGITDLSDADFSIYLPTVTVSSPNGGESWQTGTSHTITWSDNIPENVKIELHKTDTLYTTISSSTSSDGSYNWDIPLSIAPASDYKIKISSVDSSGVFDLSNANFNITPTTITVTTPDGGESWRIGTPQVITWTDNLTGNVKIELYKGGIFNSTIIGSTASDGTQNWIIPTSLTPGTDYKVKISAIDDSSIFDFSDANFTLFASGITVTSPIGGESWQAGTQQTILWNDNIDENVRIELFKGGVFNSLIDNTTPSDGLRNWDIPLAQTQGSDYTIKITSVDSSNVFDFSDSPFTIFSPSIIVTSPNGGEIWQAGSQQLITWTDNIAENVEIQLYKGGVFDSQIDPSDPSDGSYTWSIPVNTVPDSDYTIRISSVDNGVILDESDASFTIANEITVTTPDGGESWLAGTTQNITWIDNFAENVKIDLLKAGVFNSQITASAPSDGTFAWNIPAGITPGLDYRIKITSVDNPIVSDTSDNDFEIFTAGISISSPNGGESWQAGTTHPILWSDNIPEDVDITLYKGGIYHSDIITSTNSDGTYSWDIPFTLESGTDYKVKITSITDPAVSDSSNNNFTIIGNFVTVTSPNGGEIWFENQDQLITWTDNLSGNVEIQLFKGGLFHSQLFASTPSDGSQNWNPP
ncbi:MAG: Ser-Thr-rich GPI-anchored membrane family protein, partial [Ignavibacteriaceae bacterium]